MKKTSTIILTVIACTFLSSSPSKVFSQTNAKKPSWITKAPTAKNTYIGIASVSKRSMNPDGEPAENNTSQAQASSIIVSQLFFNDKYKETGKKEAVKKILGSLHLAVDANSLLGDLIMKGVYSSSFDDIFIETVFDTPLMKCQGEWEDDDEYWCYYSITEKDYNDRIKYLEDSICTQAETLWKLGLSYQQEGQLFNAAKTYTQALNLIHPLIYTQHMIKHDFENVDLFSSIYKSYVHVYDNLKITCSTNEIPAVAGESVPATFKVTVDQNGTPVRKVGVVIDYEGTIDGSLITDDDGTTSFTVVKATDEPVQAISFSIDKEGLYDLPETYAFKQLTAGADYIGTTEATVKLFDPTNYIYINVDPADSVTDKSVRQLISERNDLVIVTDKSKADLLLEAQVSTRIGQESVSAEKWQIDKYLSSLNVSVKEVASDNELFKYAINDFQYLAPSGRNKEQVLHASAKEMSRQMLREFPDKFKPFSYDKRSIVWSALK